MVAVMSKKRRLFDRSPRSASVVWIVQQDETPHNTVLGVFEDQQSASDFADEVGGQFPNGVIYAEYKVGYRYDGGN
jgi:hypothetical protein